MLKDYLLISIKVNTKKCNFFSFEKKGIATGLNFFVNKCLICEKKIKNLICNFVQMKLRKHLKFRNS